MARIFNPLDVALWSPLNRNDARAALGIPSAARVVVWHARVSISQKGLDTLLDAWETICRENSGQDFMLLLVGTGRDKDQLRRRLSAIDPKNILWLDNFVNDRTTIRQCLSAADIYAFPSRHEGFPVSPIEAMSCGLPLVATDAHGVPDILETQESSGGLIVPRDNPAEFAGALTRLLYDPSTCRELGNRARRRAEISFSLETVGQQLRTFLFNGQSDRLPSVRPPAPDTLSYSCTDP